MSEPVDVYADQFQVTTAMYGCTVNFMRTSPTPPAPGTAPQVERLGNNIASGISHPSLKLLSTFPCQTSSYNPVHRAEWTTRGLHERG